MSTVIIIYIHGDIDMFNFQNISDCQAGEPLFTKLLYLLTHFPSHRVSFCFNKRCSFVNPTLNPEPIIFTFSTPCTLLTYATALCLKRERARAPFLLLLSLERICFPACPGFHLQQQFGLNRLSKAAT